MKQFADLGDGIRHYPHYLEADIQRELAQDVFTRAEHLWLSPVTPGGQPFSVRQMNFGPLGWVSDRQGYRYQPHHPDVGVPWPDMPATMRKLWADLLPGAPPPQCCLLNHYQDTAKMGLHRDADEKDQDTPILSVSLGAPARFRIGGAKRGGPTRSVVLGTGDVIILSGPSRRFYHGIDRLLPADDLFAPDLGFDGRLNLTLRRVTRD
ncbi:alpha-ketoglutarate-dependent dioxygenase AlkB [Parvularcula marina]|uniref:Alpha-ketoglutarate-dependent dioxygenase AlkB n=1 Tax=Parvularcula marina TaxID=2292771 RepID=A0A371R7U9_9PROT|nr:alpha-ketoglutarate-dependent dioxygenase AlkB [Parvularcula marina]RFB01509.1 alpha-ketoglutarate-dependent dioxygenase AlkB [Parvularcula marina]